MPRWVFPSDARAGRPTRPIEPMTPTLPRPPIPLRARCALVGLLWLLLPTVAPANPVVSRLQLAPVGAGTGDQFGINVAGQGDLNGDGIDDFAVSGFLNDDGGVDAGRVYVYFGGHPADAVPDLVMTGEAAGDNLGQLGDSGDVDGDGYPDMIIGANMNDVGAPNAGRAYLYFGGPTMDSVADATFTGQGADYLFASRVSCGADVNGDGYADVLIGEIANPAHGARTGRAYLYYGGPGMDDVPDVTFTGETAGSEFGLVASAGDVNSDGYDDVIIGAWRNGALGADTGRAYVYFGGPAMDNVADLVLTGQAAGDRFGVSVRGCGDVNGDGHDDFAVGAYLNDAGGYDAGRAYVYFGGPGVDNVADVTLTGQASDDGFGKSVCGAGDVNRDGYGDVIVGAFTSDVSGYNSGRAYVFFGGPAMDTVADRVIDGEAAGDHLGYWVGRAGDVNGDGFPDVLVGASFSDAGGYDSGRAYLYDFNRYFLTSPNGGETWWVGTGASVVWKGPELADLWLSQDGGSSFQLLSAGVGGGASNEVSLEVPDLQTSSAVIEVRPHDGSVPGADRSDAVFSIAEPTGVAAARPAGPEFAAPWPDPARGALRLVLEPRREGWVSVRAFDLAGRLVATPVSPERLPAARAERTWRPAGLPPGVYVLRARVDGVERVRRITWLGPF